MSPAVFAKRFVLPAATVVAIAAAAAPARAQDVPNGSYLATCRGAHVHGDTLVAECQRVDGNWSRSGLDLRHCGGGDVANLNGHLVCHRHHHHDDERGPPPYGR